MLAGGGIVILYVAVYTAVEFYDLISPAVAFAAMVAVTVVAVWRADRERAQGLALLAMIGGFATPFLVGGDDAAPHVLFAYDAILVLGTIRLARPARLARLAPRRLRPRRLDDPRLGRRALHTEALALHRAVAHPVRGAVRGRMAEATRAIAVSRRSSHGRRSG